MPRMGESLPFDLTLREQLGLDEVGTEEVGTMMQNECTGCEQAFVYGYVTQDDKGNYIPGSARKSQGIIVQDTKERFWHEACFVNPEMEDKYGATKAEEVLKGEELDEEIIVRAAQISTEETRPISDVRSTAEYRKEMARILVRDALGQASERAKV